jgi:hypothetical protein
MNPHEKKEELWKDLMRAVEDEVKRFNAERRDLADAVFCPDSICGFQVYRTRGPNVHNLPMPTKKSLNCERHFYVSAIEMCVDGARVAYYQFGSDDQGNSVFCALDSDEVFTPEKIVERYLKPFLLTPEK